MYPTVYVRMYVRVHTLIVYSYVCTKYTYNAGQRPLQQQKEEMTNYQPIPVSVHQQSLPTGTLYRLYIKGL